MGSTFTGDDQGNMCPFLKNPTFPTENYCVRVAQKHFPPLITYRGLVYSPTHIRYKKEMITRQPTVYTRESAESSTVLKRCCSILIGTESLGTSGGSAHR